MKFELDCPGKEMKGNVKPDLPYYAILLTPETNEDMLELEKIVDAGLRLSRDINASTIRYRVRIEPIKLLGVDEWTKQRKRWAAQERDDLNDR